MSAITPNQWTILEALTDGPRWARSFQYVKPLVRDLGDPDQARVALRAEIAESRVIRTFEDQLAAVANGRATVIPAFVPRRVGAEMTLGGVTGEVL